MRVMIHMPGPWTPGGYGTQGAMLARHLRDAGHEVVISAFGGFVQEGEWEGMRLLACGPDPKGAELIGANYARAKAEALITVMDFWVLNPERFAGMDYVLPWVPVDTHDLSKLDRMKLFYAKGNCRLRPVAMSEHGKRMMEQAEINLGTGDIPVIPHCVRPEMTPGDRAEWRKAHHIPQDVFLIGMVGVNEGYPDRKAFDTTMCAFQMFHAKHKNARLYLHSIAQHKQGLDLIEMARSLGLEKEIGFPGQAERLLDLHSAGWMAGMHRACDVTTAASRGEGFGIPIIESMACGTPVVGSRCSAITERITPESGWLCDVQPQWNQMHARWWHTPIIKSLLHCYERAYAGARLMRGGAAKEGAKYQADLVLPLWDKLLRSL